MSDRSPRLNDIALFRAEVSEAPLDDDALAAALYDLSARSLRRRLAWLGAAARLAMSNASAPVRAAALTVLVGARGVNARRAIERSLDDDDGAVRSAAMCALRALCAAEPTRWLIATTHPRQDVRAMATSADAPSGAEVFELSLLGDEALRDRIAARARAWLRTASAVPAYAIPLLVDAVARGWIDADFALEYVARVGADKLSEWLCDQPSRVIAAPVTQCDVASFDMVDALLDLEWHVPLAEHRAHKSLWWSLITTTTDDTLRWRLVASAWVLRARHGRWSVGGLVACLLFAPATLSETTFDSAWIFTAFRAYLACSTGLYADAPASKKLRDHFALSALGADEPSALQLEQLAITLLVEGTVSTERAIALLGEERLRAAIAAHPSQAALLCAQPSANFGLLRRMLAWIDSNDPASLDRLATAILALGGPAAERLVELVGERAALAALLAHAEQPQEHSTPSDPRASVARRLGPVAVRALWQRCVATSAPPQLVLRWLQDSIDAQPADTLIDAVRALRTCPKQHALATLAKLSETASLAAAVRLALPAVEALDDRPSDDSEPPTTQAAANNGAGIVSAKPDSNALDDLTYSDDENFAHTLQRFIDWPTRGVAKALELRENPTSSPLACAALLRADDPASDVVASLQLYWPSDDEQLIALEELAATRLSQRQDLGLLASAWLYRWERHALQFSALTHKQGSLAQVLATLDNWPEALAERAWLAAARTAEISASREGGRSFDAAAWRPVVALALDEMCGDDLASVRDAAAGLLVALSRSTASRSVLDEHAHRARALRAHLPRKRDAILGAWLDASAPKRAELSAHAKALRERLRALRSGTAESALAYARELDGVEEHRATLIDALALDPPSPARPMIAALCAAWAGAARERLDAALVHMPTQVQLEIEVERSKLGESAALDRALATLAQSEQRVSDDALASLLSALGPRALEASIELLAARCETTANFALSYVLSNADFAGSSLATDASWRALTRAVEQTLLTLPASADVLRRKSARWLWARGVDTGFVVLAQEWFAAPASAPDWLESADVAHIVAIVQAALTAGPSAVAESALVDLLRAPVLRPAMASQVWAELLQGAALADTRQAAINELNRVRLFRTARIEKLRAIGRVFAWGVGVGLELTGRAMSLQLARDQALGYTRLDEDRIFVSTLPMMRGERFGRAVVEGLILHEFGHHRYHRGEAQRAAWDQGAAEGIGPLLNLVADEHLERNLRALDNDYGDRLKKLTAYAFQHMDRPIAISTLFEVLRGAMLEVLSSASVRFALDPNNVIVEHGRLLQALEKSGSSFARWVRALRMGLGDRHADEKVSRALALFSGASFRRSSMEELLEIARKVRAIFGDECRLLGVCSTHEDVGQGEDGDHERATEGISDEEIRREVDRITNPRKSDDDGMSPARPGGKRWLNVTDATDFDLIEQVVRVRYESAKHHALSARVRRSASTLRGYLERLGLHLRPERLRLRGRRVDAPRTRALVTRGDPRVLIAREIQVKTDLFIGVVIDCSGSMASGENMPRARLFGALIAEAARAMPSVDVRIFGFTDRVIYDAGDARAPAVHALDAGGGNNDAGALWHAANVARASRRRAKLLVMISDGMPTECSAAALKHLAQELTRRHKMCCAQIAVQPLPEVLFPHYVEVDGPDTDVVVRRFGRIVEGLIKHAMGIP